MKSLCTNSVLLSLLLSGLLGCSPHLSSIPQLTTQSKPTTSNAKIAVIQSVKVETSEISLKYQFEEDFKKELERVLINSGQYKYVSKSPLPISDSVDHWNFQLRMLTNLRYNWAVTWPALYPFPLWWPIQRYNAEPFVQLTFEKNSTDRPLKATVPYTEFVEQTIYGLFNKAPVNYALRNGILYGMQQLSEKIISENTEITVPLTRRSNSTHSVAVYRMQSKVLDSLSQVELSRIIAAELARRPNVQVMSWSDIETLLGFVGQRTQISTILDSKSENDLQCANDRCFAEIGQRLGARFIISGSVSPIMGRQSMTLNLIDVDEARTLHSVSRQTSSQEALLDSLPKMVQELHQRLP
jgi:hypothetical protein